MTTPLKSINIATSILWAAAIIAAAIMKAPSFYTLILLPMLAFLSLANIETIRRRSRVSIGCSS
jgi:hypothetical protein